MPTLHTEDCHEASLRGATDRRWVQYDQLIGADRKIYFNHEKISHEANLKLIIYGTSACSI
jgi:hypothetical protein